MTGTPRRSACGAARSRVYRPSQSSHGESMLQEVALGSKSLADYTPPGRPRLVDEIRELAEPLQGKRVLHVSATAFGGGVSEILYTLVPLMRDVGLETHWQVIMGREEFFNATKLLHNSLQGDPNDAHHEPVGAVRPLQPDERATSLEGEWDVIIVHDPQPAAMRQHADRRTPKHWIWRCHIDLSDAQPGADRAAAAADLEHYDATVWHMEQYVPDGHRRQRSQIVPPAIDPLSPKNMALSPEDAAFVCDQFGDRRRPADDLPGLPLRPLEGPDRRDRRLPEGDEGDPGGAARAGRLDGDRRPGGLGVLPADLRVRRPATPTSRSSTTSTTSARSR